ncbi:ferrous iron transport protein A [Candidatus Aerophobetes bacterium]|uniref:Ferrous iron transport protein A n=1 Tax=Aerophobetes bacterium TaxID=2030807 RepID=A0A662DB96_UNCAE|nr:MAG: ferrous iron transport protein A [Candidatus Aerophobetes bacterium]
MRLSDVQEGSIVKVVAVYGGKGILMKLSSMGIRPGDKLKIVSKLYGGPLIVEHTIHGCSIAIGRGMASKIEVVKQ